MKNIILIKILLERNIFGKMLSGVKERKIIILKGKDPGNVWLKTKDDGKANITEHCPYLLKR